VGSTDKDDNNRLFTHNTTEILLDHFMTRCLKSNDIHIWNTTLDTVFNNLPVIEIHHFPLSSQQSYANTTWDNSATLPDFQPVLLPKTFFSLSITWKNSAHSWLAKISKLTFNNYQ